MLARLAARLHPLLRLAQWTALAVIPVVAPHTFRRVLWEVPAGPPVFVDFRGVLLFLFDVPLLALAGATLLRLALVPGYRARLRATTGAIRRQYGGRWWLLLAGWLLLSALWATEPVLALYQAGRLALVLTMALVLADWLRADVTGETVNSLTTVWLLGALAQSSHGLLQLFNDGWLGLDWLGELPYPHRSLGLTVNPNNFGGYLVVALFVALWALWRAASVETTGESSSPDARRASLRLASYLIGLGLVSSLSRAALVGVVVAAVGVGAPILRRHNLSRRMWIALGGLSLIGGLLIASVLLVRADRGTPEALLARLIGQYMPATLEVIAEAPLTGVGAGNLMLAVLANNPTTGGVLLPAEVAALLPGHNLYAVLWAEGGLVALGLFLLAGAALLRQTWRTRDPALRALGAGVLALAVIHCFDYYFWLDYRSQALMLWLVGLWWGQAQSKTQRPPNGGL